MSLSFFTRLSMRSMWFGMLVKMGKEANVKNAIGDILCLEDSVVPNIGLSCNHRDLAGYVLIKLIMDVYSYNILLQLDYVYRFLGSINVEGKNIYYLPQRIPEEQISNIKRYLNGHEVHHEKKCFSIGDEIQIKSGDLINIKGKVISMNDNYVNIMPQIATFSQVIKVPVEKCSLV